MSELTHRGEAVTGISVERSCWRSHGDGAPSSPRTGSGRHGGQTRRRPRGLRQPGRHARPRHRHRHEEVWPRGRRQSALACLRPGTGARARGQGPCHPSPSGRDGLERRGRRALARDLACLVWRWGSARHRAGTRLGLGAGRAHRAHGPRGGVTRAGEPLVAAGRVVPGGRPSAPALPWRPRDGLGRPSQGHTRHLAALWTAGLPSRVGPHGPHECYGRREAAGHPGCGRASARIPAGCTRAHALGRASGDDGWRSRDVCGRGRGRVDVVRRGTLRLTGRRQGPCDPVPWGSRGVASRASRAEGAAAPRRRGGMPPRARGPGRGRQTAAARAGATPRRPCRSRRPTGAVGAGPRGGAGTRLALVAATGGRAAGVAGSRASARR
jgi:hypothetical protein